MTVNITLNEISVKNALCVLELFYHDPALEVFTRRGEDVCKDINIERMSTSTVSSASAPTNQPISADKSEDSQDTPEPEKSQPQYTIEDVRAAFSAYAKAKGKDKAKELLAKFGASKVTALESTNYNAVMNDIKEA